MEFTTVNPLTMEYQFKQNSVSNILGRQESVVGEGSANLDKGRLEIKYSMDPTDAGKLKELKITGTNGIAGSIEDDLGIVTSIFLTGLPKFEGVRFVSDSDSGDKIFAPINTRVEARVTLSTRAATDGIVIIEFRRDLIKGLDASEKPPCEENVFQWEGDQEFKCPFTPTEYTGVTDGSIRHWFIRVFFGEYFIHNPENEKNTRAHVLVPPGL